MKQSRCRPVRRPSAGCVDRGDRVDAVVLSDRQQTDPVHPAWAERQPVPVEGPAGAVRVDQQVVGPQIAVRRRLPGERFRCQLDRSASSGRTFGTHGCRPVGSGRRPRGSGRGSAAAVVPSRSSMKVCNPSSGLGSITSAIRSHVAVTARSLGRPRRPRHPARHPLGHHANHRCSVAERVRRRRWLGPGWRRQLGDYLGFALVGVVGVEGVVGGLDEDAAAVGQLDRGCEAAGEAGADRGAAAMISVPRATARDSWRAAGSVFQSGRSEVAV